MDKYNYASNADKLIDSTGRRLTVGLFKEFEGASAPFSLKDWRKVYVEVADPTGYQAAEVLLNNWEHWLLLCANKRFAAELEEWNKEVAIKLSSQAIKQLVGHSKQKHGVAAAKWLAERGYVLKNIKKKKDNEEESALDKEIKRNVAADAARLGLSVVSK